MGGCMIAEDAARVEAAWALCILMTGLGGASLISRAKANMCSVYVRCHDKILLQVYLLSAYIVNFYIA